MMDDLRDPMCQIPPAFTAVEPQGLLRGGYVEPPDLAERWNLKEKMSNGKTEYSGPNPTGNGATKDGFILFTDGTGWDRKLDRYYTSKEIAEMAGIASEAYGPYRPVTNRQFFELPDAHGPRQILWTSPPIYRLKVD